MPHRNPDQTALSSPAEGPLGNYLPSDAGAAPAEAALGNPAAGPAAGPAGQMQGDPAPGESMPPPPPAPTAENGLAAAERADEPGKKSKPGKSRKSGRPAKDRKVSKQAAPGSPGARKGKRIWLAAAGVVLLAGGAVGGHFLTDPTRSDEYAALADESAQRQAKLEKSEESYRTLNAQYTKLSSGMTSRESKVSAREAAVAATEADVKARETAVSSAEAAKAANTITDGTWTVGKTVSPGTYTTTTEVGSSCYWGIYRSGSNGDDIIENDIPGGGRPTVTISEGQDFKSSRCGKWEKQ